MEFVRENLCNKRFSVSSVRADKRGRTNLNNNFHQILLRNYIFTINNLLQYTRQDILLIHIEIHTVQLGQSNKVGTNQNTKFFSLNFAFFAIARMALVLETDPELIHLDEVREDE